MLTRLRRALSGDEGASAVEYSLLAVAIAAVVVGIVFALGRVTRSQISQADACFATSGKAAGC